MGELMHGGGLRLMELRTGMNLNRRSRRSQRELREEAAEVFVGEAFHEGGVVIEGGVHEVAFFFLEFEDFFFDGAGGDEFVNGDGTLLTDAVGPVGGLGFDGGVPPWVEVDDGVGFGEVESVAAGFEADEKDTFVRIGLESVDLGGAVGGGAVDVTVVEVGGSDGFLEEAEHAGEGAEDDDGVAAVADFLQQFGNGFDFT